jgi:hypothetical protein
MNRNNPYDKYKITTIATKTVALDFMMDSFGIEKVRLQALKFDKSIPIKQRLISCYLDFETLFVLAEEVRNGKFFQKAKASSDEGKPYTISMGGTKKNSRYGDIPESKMIKVSFDKADPKKMFLNLTLGKGKLSKTGLIEPDGKPEVSITVVTNPVTFRDKIITCEKYAEGYLPNLVGSLMKEYKKEMADRGGKEQNLEETVRDEAPADAPDADDIDI